MCRRSNEPLGSQRGPPLRRGDNGWKRTAAHYAHHLVTESVQTLKRRSDQSYHETSSLGETAGLLYLEGHGGKTIPSHKVPQFVRIVMLPFLFSTTSITSSATFYYHSYYDDYCARHCMATTAVPFNVIGITTVNKTESTAVASITVTTSSITTNIAETIAATAVATTNTATFMPHYTFNTPIATIINQITMILIA